MDNNGNAFVVGRTVPSTSQRRSARLNHSGGLDAFVAKVDPSGTDLVYSGFIGGADGESGESIAVDAPAQPTSRAPPPTHMTFPVGPGVVGGPDPTYNGGFADAFVVKVKPDGTGSSTPATSAAPGRLWRGHRGR